MPFRAIANLCLFTLFFAISIFIVDFRVRQNLDKNLTLVDPDPGKAYTRAKKAIENTISALWIQIPEL